MHSLVADAAARVVRWVTVPDSWAGHRPEPLAPERLWACVIQGTGSRQAGLDDAGRVVLVGPGDRLPAEWRAPPDWIDLVERASDGRSVTVHGFGRAGERRATTSLDAGGRPVVTTYAGDAPEERYEYASDGRLIAINESPGVMTLTPPQWRATPDLWGGVPTMERLNVEWDDAQPSAIRRASDRRVIWERLTVPWPEALRGFARALADTAAASLAEEARKLGVDPHDEVFGLALVADDVSWPSTSMGLWAGLQATRERLLADHTADAFTVEEYLWLLQDPYEPSLAAPVVLSDELDRAALRAAAMHDPGDARRTLAQATVPLLATHDWNSTFTPTPDFAAYVIGFDDDWPDIYDSMVAANPPERLAARAARWRGSPYPPIPTP
jgi:hypothetical protein